MFHRVLERKGSISVMKAVTQTIVNKAEADLPGDCLRATMASLLNLNILQVPHFMLYSYGDEKREGFNPHGWFNVQWWFLACFGYDLRGSWRVEKEDLKDLINFEGFLECDVPSKSFPGSRHSVIIDLEGKIVHDPNPNKLWEGTNVYDLPRSDSIAIMVVYLKES